MRGFVALDRFAFKTPVKINAHSGRGVALAKRTLAQADLASGRLVAPFPDGSEAVGFAYSVVQPRDRPPSPSATAFVAWLKRQAVDHDNTMGQL